MTNREGLLNRIFQERTKYITNKGYCPNRIYMSEMWFLHISGSICEKPTGKFILLGMEVLLNSHMGDYAVLCHTKDLPDFRNLASILEY